MFGETYIVVLIELRDYFLNILLQKKVVNGEIYVVIWRESVVLFLKKVRSHAVVVTNVVKSEITVVVGD